MRSLFRFLTVLTVVGILVFGVAPEAMAAEIGTSDVVIVREGVVVRDDLYAAGLSVRISGEVHGDLIATAAEEIVIDGLVTGSVTAAASSVIINGFVEGSVRAVAGRVTVTGKIGKDLVTSAFNTRLETSSLIEGEVLVWGFRLWALGQIAEDLTGTQRFLDLAGRVGGDVVVSVHQLNVVDTLAIDGNLSYRSAREASGMEKADVVGVVTRRSPLPPNIRIRALAVFARAMVALFLTIAAVTVIWGWPERTEAAAARVRIQPWKNWLLGLGIFLTPLLLVGVTVLLFLLAPPAMGLPLLAVLIPVIVALVGLLLAVTLIAGIPSVVALGRRFKRFGLLGSTLIGSLVVAVVWMLPLVGVLVPILLLPLGLGAWILSRAEVEEASQPALESQPA